MAQPKEGRLVSRTSLPIGSEVGLTEGAMAPTSSDWISGKALSNFSLSSSASSPVPACPVTLTSCDPLPTPPAGESIMSNEGKASMPPEVADAEGSSAAGAAGAEPKFEKSSNSSRPDEDAAGGAAVSDTPPPLANRSASSPVTQDNWVEEYVSHEREDPVVRYEFRVPRAARSLAK